MAEERAAADQAGALPVRADLEPSAERLRAALRAGRMVAWEIDLATGRARRSETFREVLGVDDELADPHEFINLVHPDDRPLLEAELRRILTDADTEFDVQYRLVRPDGTVAWFEDRGRVVHGPDGRPLRVEGIMNDISAQKAAEAEIHALNQDLWKRMQAQSMLAAIVQSSDDAIIGLDAEARVLSWNAGAERIFGYPAATIVGRCIDELAPDARRGEIGRLLAVVRQGGRVAHFETQRVRRDGQLIDVSVTLSPIHDAEGRIVGASKIARDVTAAKRAEQELVRAKEAAEAANRAKDHFLAVLSHELRTPLAPVLATVISLERNPALPAELRPALALVRRNVELEARLIDDLLDLTRIARGKMQLSWHDVDLRQAIKDAVQASWMLQPEDKQLRLELDLGAPDHVLGGDGPRLTQVLWNLLHNAIKFTPAGGRITVRTRLEPKAAPKGLPEMVVEVEDTGIGIPPELLPHVFEAFEQGQADTRRHGGLGIGLAISAQLAEMHGGSLTAASDGPGRGATFTLRLPYVRARHEAAPSGRGTASQPTDRLHVLLVEDHVDTAEAMSMLLRGMGFEVSVAGTIAEAERIAADTGEARPIGVVVSDLDLPDGSGLDLMRSLHERHGLRGIALSGFGMEDDIRRSREAGFERHLTKPVNLDLLERAIRDIAAPR